MLNNTLNEKKIQIKTEQFNLDRVEINIQKLEEKIKKLLGINTPILLKLEKELQEWKKFAELLKTKELNAKLAIDFLLYGYGYTQEKITDLQTILDSDPEINLKKLVQPDYGSGLNTSGEKPIISPSETSISPFYLKPTSEFSLPRFLILKTIFSDTGLISLIWQNQYGLNQVLHDRNPLRKANAPLDKDFYTTLDRDYYDELQLDLVDVWDQKLLFSIFQTCFDLYQRAIGPTSFERETLSFQVYQTVQIKDDLILNLSPDDKPDSTNQNVDDFFNAQLEIAQSKIEKQAQLDSGLIDLKELEKLQNLFIDIAQFTLKPEPARLSPKYAQLQSQSSINTAQVEQSKDFLKMDTLRKKLRAECALLAQLIIKNDYKISEKYLDLSAEEKLLLSKIQGKATLENFTYLLNNISRVLDIYTSQRESRTSAVKIKNLSILIGKLAKSLVTDLELDDKNGWKPFSAPTDYSQTSLEIQPHPTEARYKEYKKEIDKKVRPVLELNQVLDILKIAEISLDELFTLAFHAGKREKIYLTENLELKIRRTINLIGIPLAVFFNPLAMAGTGGAVALINHTPKALKIVKTEIAPFLEKLNIKFQEFVEHFNLYFEDWSKSNEHSDSEMMPPKAELIMKMSSPKTIIESFEDITSAGPIEYYVDDENASLLIVSSRNIKLNNYKKPLKNPALKITKRFKEGKETISIPQGYRLIGAVDVFHENVNIIVNRVGGKDASIFVDNQNEGEVVIVDFFFEKNSDFTQESKFESLKNYYIQKTTAQNHISGIQEIGHSEEPTDWQGITNHIKLANHLTKLEAKIISGEIQDIKQIVKLVQKTLLKLRIPYDFDGYVPKNDYTENASAMFEHILDNGKGGVCWFFSDLTVFILERLLRHLPEKPLIANVSGYKQQLLSSKSILTTDLHEWPVILFKNKKGAISILEIEATEASVGGAGAAKLAKQIRDYQEQNGKLELDWQHELKKLLNIRLSDIFRMNPLKTAQILPALSGFDKNDIVGMLSVPIIGAILAYSLKPVLEFITYVDGSIKYAIADIPATVETIPLKGVEIISEFRASTPNNPTPLTGYITNGDTRQLNKNIVTPLVTDPADIRMRSKHESNKTITTFPVSVLELPKSSKDGILDNTVTATVNTKSDQIPFPAGYDLLGSDTDQFEYQTIVPKSSDSTTDSVNGDILKIVWKNNIKPQERKESKIYFRKIAPNPNIPTQSNQNSPFEITSDIDSRWIDLECSLEKINLSPKFKQFIENINKQYSQKIDQINEQYGFRSPAEPERLRRLAIEKLQVKLARELERYIQENVILIQTSQIYPKNTEHTFKNAIEKFDTEGVTAIEASVLLAGILSSDLNMNPYIYSSPVTVGITDKIALSTNIISYQVVAKGQTFKPISDQKLKEFAGQDLSNSAQKYAQSRSLVPKIPVSNPKINLKIQQNDPMKQIQNLVPEGTSPELVLIVLSIITSSSIAYLSYKTKLPQISLEAIDILRKIQQTNPQVFSDYIDIARQILNEPNQEKRAQLLDIIIEEKTNSNWQFKIENAYTTEENKSALDFLFCVNVYLLNRNSFSNKDSDQFTAQEISLVFHQFFDQNLQDFSIPDTQHSSNQSTTLTEALQIITHQGYIKASDMFLESYPKLVIPFKYWRENEGLLQSIKNGIQNFKQTQEIKDEKIEILEKSIILLDRLIL